MCWWGARRTTTVADTKNRWFCPRSQAVVAGQRLGPSQRPRQPHCRELALRHICSVGDEHSLVDVEDAVSQRDMSSTAVPHFWGCPLQCEWRGKWSVPCRSTTSTRRRRTHYGTVEARKVFRGCSCIQLESPRGSAILLGDNRAFL